MSKELLLDYFLHLVQINAVSLQERPVADYLYGLFSDWALDISEDDAGSKINGNCGNLIVRIPGYLSDITAPLLLVAHMDTVSPTYGIKTIIKNDVIQSDGTTILGADNRAGVALILYIVDNIISNRLPHRPLEIIFSVAEELGMLGTMAIDYNQIEAKEAYIFDCSAKPGSYVSQTPTAMDFKIIFRGKAAHSAVSPEKGINALTMAMSMIQLFPVGRLSSHSVANIGTIHGGTAVNVVPEWVELTGEFRSLDPVELNDIEARLKLVSDQSATNGGGKIERTISLGFTGFKLQPEMPVIKRLHNALTQLGLSPNAMEYSGGSDANVLYQHGIHAVNMGIGASNAHSMDEKISLNDMMVGTELVLRMIGSK